MDTRKDSAASDVPTFKVARVGQERKRKGGGFSFLRGGGTRGAWSGATGGSGAGGAVNALGMSVSKALMSVFVASIVGSAAVYAGISSASKTAPAAKTPVFSQDRNAVKIEGDTSNLPSNGNTIPNSMGFITGSKDGLTPEERAKRDADAAAAAEAQRVADEKAAKEAEAADKTAGNPAVDPNALLASAKGDGGAAKGGAGFGKKFGALSSGMGGGSSLSGGAGMSGGVNRQFGGGGSIAKGKGGAIAAMKGASRPTYSKSGNSKLAASRTKGFARKQLANANAYSRRGASAGKGETAASDAGSAFDNNPGAGNTIEGPGIGKGKGAGSGADGSANPNNGGPTGGGGQVDCGPDKYQNVDGGCSDIKTDSGTDANKTLTMLVQIAQALLLAIAVITLIAYVMETNPYTYAMGKVLRGVVGVMGGIIALMGLAIMAMGDFMQGAIFAGIGGFIAIACWGVGGQALTAPGATIAAGAGLLLSQAGSALKGSKKEDAPVAAQQ